MKITFPELSLVILMGPSGSGKSTFARKHFLSTEILSSDDFRAMLSDSSSDQSASTDAFELVHAVVEKRLKRGLLTVVDATNLKVDARTSLKNLSKRFHVFPVIIAFDMDEKICQDRNRQRKDLAVPEAVVRTQSLQMKNSLKQLDKESFRYVFHLRTEAEVESTTIERQRLWNNRKEEKGPFDIIGDIHGCRLELDKLLKKLGYSFEETDFARAPLGRKAVFLGDLVDRGPDTPGVLRLIMNMVEQGQAICVPGNHDVKLVRKLKGKNVKINHGLAESLAQFEGTTEEFKTKVMAFVDGLVSHHVLDEGRLVVAHAGLKESMQGRGSGEVRSFALYGDTEGEIDQFGLPVRLNWAADYRGKAMVVYGHTPVPEVEWFNNTVNVDTGCVFGGKLTALRYPEREFVSVVAEAVYCEPVKPFKAEDSDAVSIQLKDDAVLDYEDFEGKILIKTRTRSNIYIQEEQSSTAMEHLSRFAIDPRWLIYLPPTMAPTQASDEEGYLEYPSDAFTYYKRREVKRVICEEKHMGSRAVIIVCKDNAVVHKRFGIETHEIGICYTRTGRRFFRDRELETAFLQRTQEALSKSGFWEQHDTDWVCLDAELMPWSLKAEGTIMKQYAAVGSSATFALGISIESMRKAEARGLPISEELNHEMKRAALVDDYIKAYQGYCWNVKSIADIRCAPFHVMATEGRTYFDRTHDWHLETIAAICAADSEILVATRFLPVNLEDPEDLLRAIEWWKKITSSGGEGMVVKALDFATQGLKGRIQPAIKVRGPDYLRIIYGPEYSLEQNLVRLRKRSVELKHHLALSEFALGLEALERFVKREPLRNVHQCIVGILGLESGSIDPRL
ncbi:MAG: polynucleotide kinase-phosphatase [Oligoflexus sp.]|nr:polynucleotide kinase-phosphatase [Oligoflexus sp.]